MKAELYGEVGTKEYDNLNGDVCLKLGKRSIYR